MYVWLTAHTVKSHSIAHSLPAKCCLQQHVLTVWQSPQPPAAAKHHVLDKLCRPALLLMQVADDEDAMLAAAIAASLQDAPAQQQQQAQSRPQQAHAQATNMSHPPEAAGQTPAG